MTVPSTTDRESDLGFRARALAQAHPLSAQAAGYRRWRLSRDVDDYPIPELATWAATAFLTGYCVRCVQDADRGVPTSVAQSRDIDAQTDQDWTDLERRGEVFVAALRTSCNSEQAVVLAALDQVIGREIDKRSEHVREELSPQQWEQFELFVSWWVMHGYAIASVERDCDNSTKRPAQP